MKLTQDELFPIFKSVHTHTCLGTMQKGSNIQLAYSQRTYNNYFVNTHSVRNTEGIYTFLERLK